MLTGCYQQRSEWGISTEEPTLPALIKQEGYRTALTGKWHLGYDAGFHPMNYGFYQFRGFGGEMMELHTQLLAGKRADQRPGRFEIPESLSSPSAGLPPPRKGTIQPVKLSSCYFNIF